MNCNENHDHPTTEAFAVSELRDLVWQIEIAANRTTCDQLRATRRSGAEIIRGVMETLDQDRLTKERQADAGQQTRDVPSTLYLMDALSPAADHYSERIDHYDELIATCEEGQRPTLTAERAKWEKRLDRTKRLHGEINDGTLKLNRVVT